MKNGKTYFEKIALENNSPEDQERILKLFEDNINLANRLAKKYYQTSYWSFDEAIQIARLGLWKACLIWDPSKFRLSTLAYNIMNRDFIDYDRQQKRQPDILFNIEDNCVTDDINLEDVLIDESPTGEDIIITNTEVQDLNQDIIYILDDIAEEQKLQKSIVKLIYLVYIETNQDNKLNMRVLDFVPKQTVKIVVALLQEKLAELY